MKHYKHWQYWMGYAGKERTGLADSSDSLRMGHLQADSENESQLSREVCQMLQLHVIVFNICIWKSL